MQYELSQKESNLLKAGLHFLIQPDKIRNFKIFTIFQKIHRSFVNNLKSEETKSQIKAHWIALDWNALFRVDKIVEKKIMIVINA